MDILLELNVAKIIIVYAFLFIIICAFLKYYIFLKELDNSNIQRIMGGLSVFLVAIISENIWVVWTSLFIGGLIIASEEFMKSLVALIKSNKDRVGETLEALKADTASRVVKINMQEENNGNNEETAEEIKIINNDEFNSSN